MGAVSQRNHARMDAWLNEGKLVRTERMNLGFPTVMVEGHALGDDHIRRPLVVLQARAIIIPFGTEASIAWLFDTIKRSTSTMTAIVLSKACRP